MVIIFLKQKQKEYYAKNKEALLDKAKIKITCECGSTIRKADKSSHYKSKKHQQFLNK